MSSTTPNEEIQTSIPIVISRTSIMRMRVLSSATRADSITFPYVLTRILHMGVCDEPLNGGTIWHTHPLHLGPGLSNEDIWYVLRGQGVMFYKRSGELKTLEFPEPLT